MRVGIGHDTHRLVEGRPLILGGLRIDHPRGLAGHSDADVVCHAVGDGMADHVGVGMPGQPAGMVDPQSPQDQRTPLHQPMRVVPDPHPQDRRPPPDRQNRLPGES